MSRRTDRGVGEVRGRGQSEVLGGGQELLRAQKMSKAGKRCVESFVDVTWFSKNSQEGRRVRFLERDPTDWALGGGFERPAATSADPENEITAQ